MKTILLALAILGCAFVVNAQDTLFLINGKKVAVQILATRQFGYLYNKATWKTGRTKLVSKSELARVRFANGRVDTFFYVDGNNISAASPLLKTDSMYELGKSDAKIYYGAYNGASTGTFLATFLGSPAIGAVTATIASVTPPRKRNLQTPNLVLAENPTYMKGYKTKAWSIKRGKVWVNWGCGVVSLLCTVLLLSALGHQQ